MWLQAIGDREVNSKTGIWPKGFDNIKNFERNVNNKVSSDHNTIGLQH